MNQFFAFFKEVANFILSLKIEQITLLSIFVTLIIFLFGQRSETKLKKLEARREEYQKFIGLLQKIYTNKLKFNDKSRSEFFDAGVSLLIYGSKRVYKKYVFFREYSNNPIIQKSKYNDKSVTIYIIADILKTIRHEVGMTRFGELESNEVLSFFVNDIGTNPVSKIQSYKARYCIFMLKAELFFVDRHQFVFAKKLYYYFIKPVLGCISLLLKYVIVIPLGGILIFLFPKLKGMSNNKPSNNSNE